MEVIINDFNLKDNDIDKYSNKVRAILLSDDKILVSHYMDIYMLPGGKIDNESAIDALIRELKEEIGIVYKEDELNELLTIKHYQNNYPTRDDKIANRLVITNYYIGKYKGIDLDNISRTENEINGNFHLELITIDEFIKLLDVKSTNPRKEYFDKENIEVVKVLKKEYLND